MSTNLAWQWEQPQTKHLSHWNCNVKYSSIHFGENQFWNPGWRGISGWLCIFVPPHVGGESYLWPKSSLVPHSVKVWDINPRSNKKKSWIKLTGVYSLGSKALNKFLYFFHLSKSKWNQFAHNNRLRFFFVQLRF